MKKTKVFYGNQYVGNITVGTHIISKSKSRFDRMKIMIPIIAKRILKTSAITVSVMWIAVGALHVGMLKAPTVYAEKEVIKEVKAHAPVMDRILKCESGGTHIDPKTGQVLMRANKNGSIDIGKYQINSVWFKKATELKLNLSIEKDNESMAYYLYENFGTEDWYSSKACWDK